MNNTIRCHDCDRPARWNVWYADCTLPAGGCNIAYNKFCDEHAAQELIAGRNGYPVSCLRLVEDQYLELGDRARNRQRG